VEAANRDHENLCHAGFYWMHVHEIMVLYPRAPVAGSAAGKFLSYQQTRLFLAGLPAICYRVTRIASRSF
jgi:hypothetical protein